MPTVEDELAFHQQHSAELAVSLSIEPDNPVLQEQLKESLEQIRLGASLVDNPEAADRARAAIDLLKSADLDNKQGALAEIITASVPAPVLRRRGCACDAEFRRGDSTQNCWKFSCSKPRKCWPVYAIPCHARAPNLTTRIT